MGVKNSRRCESVVLPSPAYGTEQTVEFHHYGQTETGLKVYIQAALHADEIPGLLVVRHLLTMLDEADDHGAIVGNIVVAPFANPIGLNQFWLGTQQGRFNAENGKNFNRHYPDLGAAVAERIEGRLTDDANANVELIRKSCLEWLAESAPETAVDVLKHTLLSHSIDADIVLDLHCDLEALMYMFILPELLPEASDLAAYLGCRGLLLAEPSPDMCFDEANSLVWRKLAQRFTDFPIPHACMSTTLELRGMSDVNSALAEQDANAIFAYLQSRGIIAGEPKPVPEMQCEPTPFEAVGKVIAPRAGVISFDRSVGEEVAKGEQVATLHPLDKRKPPTVLCAPNAGLLFSRRNDRYALPGQRVCEVAGKELLAENIGKDLLSD